MALTHIEAADSRQNLGMSGIIQKNTLTPAAADYPTGGYPINPQNWGMGVIHGLVQLGLHLAAPTDVPVVPLLELELPAAVAAGHHVVHRWVPTSDVEGLPHR